MSTKLERELDAMLEAAEQEDEERRQYNARHGSGYRLEMPSNHTKRQLYERARRGLSLVPDNPPG